MASPGGLNPPEDDIDEYPVERILASRTIDRTSQYLVKWEGYPDEECTWEPEENFGEETLAEWQSQRANGNHPSEAEVAEVEAKMKALEEQKLAGETDDSRSEDNTAANDDNLESAIESTSRRVTPPQKAPTRRHMSSIGSNEPSAKRPRLQTTTQATDLQLPEKLSTNAPLSRVPTFGSRKGFAHRIPKQGPRKTSLNNTKKDHFELGDRFHNLKHMNNYQKRLRREVTPDMSKLDLRDPGEFDLPKRVIDVQHQDKRYDERDESPLFVPETPSDQTGDAFAENDIPQSVSARSEEVNSLQETSALPRLITAHARQKPSEIRTPRPASPTAPLETDLPPPPTLTHRSRSPPHDISKPRLHDPTRTQFPSSAYSAVPRREEIIPSHKPASQQVAEDESVATEVAPLSTESHPHSSASEIKPQRPVLARAISQPTPFTSNIASMARRENAKPPRRYSDDGENHARPSSIPSRVPGVPVPTPTTVSGPTGRLITARNGRTWFWGELVVILNYGKHSVGHLKVLHLPGWLVSKFANLKQGPDLVVHFEEKWVMTKVQFASFASNLSSEIGLGAIQPYEDTASGAASLAEHLETHDICAVWEFPGPAIPGFVVVLYSCKAPSWGFLGARPVPGLDSRLHLLVKNKKHDVHLGAWLLSQKGDVNVEPGAPAPTSSTSIRRLPPQEAGAPILGDSGDLVVNKTEESLGTTVRPRSPYFGARSPRSPRTPRSPSRYRRDSYERLVNNRADTMAAGSALVFPANFKDLGSGLGDRDDRKKHIFYIAFAKSHPAEARAVENWLLKHEVKQRAIYLDEEKDAWSEFRTELSSKQGIVLFRQGTWVYYTMKNLAAHLYQGITCFNVSFPGDEGYTTDGGEALGRIFTRGTVLFITERSMLDNPAEVLVAMKWFEKRGSGKVQTHKMALVPNAREWVLARLAQLAREAKHPPCNKDNDEQQAKATQAQEQEHYLGMLEVLYRLDAQAHANLDAAAQDDPDWWLLAGDEPGEEHSFLVSVPCDLPGYDYHHDDDYNYVVGSDGAAAAATAEESPMAPDRVQARDELLVQYFVGWAALHVEHYKNFYLVDDHQTNETVKDSCHVYFRKPAKFVDMIEKLEKQAASRRG
ncbi:hypothetical protein PV08_09539 [Exophiala spinifera]|uniref:Chromo domain-containing protein n=1 Tax=Exophiala spinifera TaxID=91928 RepID=A0A0D2AZV4_9EURO|nr:uncharacterized protein PV08_09539 [Exophiala spinifera]KIW12263.1 hypothetical protein PV08_09539 [Exophiala spinifera]